MKLSGDLPIVYWEFFKKILEEDIVNYLHIIAKKKIRVFPGGLQKQ